MTIDDNNKNNPNTLATTHDAELKREQEMLSKGRQRAEKRRKDLHKRQGLSQTTAGHKGLERAIPGVVDAIEAFILEQEAKKGGPKPMWLDVVKETKLELTANCALQCCKDTIGQHDETYNALIYRTGKAMQAVYLHWQLTKTRSGRMTLRQIKDQVLPYNDSAEKRQQKAIEKLQEWGHDLDDWDENKYRNVGSFLIAAVFRGCDDFQEVKITPDHQDHPVRYVELTPAAQDRLDNDNEFLDGLSPMFAPIIGVPPIDWSEHNQGGYHDPAVAKLVPLIKNAPPEQRRAAQEAIRIGQMDHCLDALNTLQRTPYTINSDVLDAVQWVIQQQKGRELPKFPKMIIHPTPERVVKAYFDKWSTEEKVQHYRERDSIQLSNREARANKINMRTHISQAKELLEAVKAGFDRFWLPFQFDRRGRVYHTPDFGPHSADWLRSLFMMKNKGKVTGHEDYLYLQIANSWGDGDGRKLDKASYMDRVMWVHDNHTNIFETGKCFKASWPWWKKADAPFQFYAACREYYLWKTIGDDYESGLIVSIDATQSGIQHYAASSLSVEDGEKVNLMPTPFPADLYTEVMERSIELMDTDIQRLEAVEAEPGDDPEQHEKDMKKLQNLRNLKKVGLTRSVVKRNVMTWAYSSEVFGFAEQLRSDWFSEFTARVRDPLDEMNEHPFGPDQGFSASFVLAEINFRAIRQVIVSAHKGMDFLQKCAAILARARHPDQPDTDEDDHGIHFAFTTKLGFPSYQRYVDHKKDPRRQKVFWWDRDVLAIDKENRCSIREFTEVVNRVKSKNAVSPNVIHAMDATHLMQTVLTCKANGVQDLMVVHDSFGTTVDKMPVLWGAVRKAFIDVYDGYCLYEDVLNQCKQRHPDPDSVDWPAIPEKGSEERGLLDLQLIAKANYPFS